MPVQLQEDAFGDVRNANALAMACDFAYLGAEEGAKSFRDEFGMEARLISVDNTQAYLAWNDDHVLVAFRGSENPASIDGLKDWLLTNALNLLIQPDGPLATEFAAAGAGAKFHAGFVSAITAIWPELFPAVEAELKKKDRPFWITGHSLGGSLALLSAWLFQRKFLNVHQVYTFGAPMIGNADVSAAFNRELSNKIFRYVNSPDPVPLLPMISLMSNQFEHCDRLVALGDVAAVDLVAYFREAAGETVSGLLSGNVADQVWEALKKKLTAHFIGDYRQLIK